MGSRKERVLTVTTTETCCNYLHLNMTLLWGPKGACFVAEVLCAVEDGCVVGGEGGGRHIAESGGGRAGRAAYGKSEEDDEGPL